MSDNRTAELRISEPLRGFIRHQSNRAYIDGGQARWLTDIADKIDAKHEQAIAATLGSGTCEVVASYDTSDVDSRNSNAEWYFAFSCGHELYWDEGEPPKHCPECGARIRKAVKR